LDLPEYDYGVISPVLNDQDDLFLETGADQFSISVLQRARLSWNRKLVATEIVRQLNPLGDLAVDSKSKCLYATRTHGGTVELDRFYQASGQFRPFLPGIPATAVDFSRDGKSIVFVHEPEHMLWVSGVDGSDARQMDTGDVHEIELPRWSPDGKQIAFMGRIGGAPFRIFVIPAAGGKSREASEGTDNQGAPTWSPDGRRLVYGRVRCQEEKTCAIQEIDLKNHRQTMVPGSEGLTTARWSPDGRYVAALRDDRHEVFLLDRHNGEWRKIAEGVNGNDLSWGKDSRTIYASRPGSQRPEVLRISVKDGKAVNAFDLSPFSKLSGRIDTWFAMAPDDSILFLRFTSSDEVYAMSYLER
jgi:dipeptidyl aminopeptidase/acylaminoacyl peptidase